MMSRGFGLAGISPTVVAILVLGLWSGTSVAQSTGTLSQLDGRASPVLKAQVAAVADSVARAGLPVGPLVDKALEGVSKGADDQRIMAAVRAVATDLGVARRALGVSSRDELAAGVAALRAGSSAGELAELRRLLPERPLVVPLSVLASLLVDGAPAPSAIVAVVSNARQRDDADLLAYGMGVSRDIASGVAPLTAMSGRATIATATLRQSSSPAARPPSPAKPKP
jgi:hypothetical protein